MILEQCCVQVMGLDGGFRTRWHDAIMYVLNDVDPG